MNRQLNNFEGIRRCLLYAFPPNALSLCGPDNKKHTVAEYVYTGIIDKGTTELLEHFKTLYPYLTLIASYNSIHDPFDNAVVDAYWIGNSLLRSVSPTVTSNFISDNRRIKHINKKKTFEKIMDAVSTWGIPHHSFHVLCVWKQTTDNNLPDSIEHADACIINWGTITSTNGKTASILTQRLTFDGTRIAFMNNVQKHITLPNTFFSVGDTVSYHWGVACEVLSKNAVYNLKRFTLRSIRAANSLHAL